MNVDLEAIAQRGRCDVANLRNALPLLQQGYSPPFLARYRRDELGGIDETSLWALHAAINMEQTIADRRNGLLAIWEQTPLKDPAIGHSIRKANSIRMLDRLARRLKSETADHAGDSVRLAVRLLNPQKGDKDDFTQVVAKVDGIGDPAKAVADVDPALAKRLIGDPRLINSAVRWLVKNARIQIAGIHDPHTGGEEGKEEQSSAAVAAETEPTKEADSTTEQATAAETPAASTVENEAETPPPSAEPTSQTDAAAESEAKPTDPTNAQGVQESGQGEPVAQTASDPSSEQSPSVPEATDGEGEKAAAEPSPAAPAGSPPAEATPTTSTETESASQAEPKVAQSSQKPAKDAAAKPAKKSKKISPRQRRRRWLVSVLKPLEGKRFSSNKLSSFQIVMLARALRSQVAQCAFEYDAAKLVAELQRTVAGFNRHIEAKLRETVLQHEADIREAAEAAWWDELQERASTRLIGIAAEHLRRQTDRGGVDAKVVMSIDAVGPRTAATTIVAADGRLLHSEDLPCQLAAAPRSQAVARMGELIHTHHVDLIVLSNGPARRACMVVIADLIAQSPAKSLRWTLADRSGADAYAGSSVADQEMKTTPRRFRAAAWLAFSVLQPAQALAKVDPLKLRLGSFQRELSDDAMLRTLENVMVSGASRGGVDVNAAPVSWLSRLPGVSQQVAEAIDAARQQELFASRDTIAELEQWESVVQSRQAMPFLRVFGSEEVLDGTLIHPDDYPLAKKLASTLEVELPPTEPPGYVVPNYEEETKPEPPAETEAKTTGDPDQVESPDSATADTEGEAPTEQPSPDEAAATAESTTAPEDQAAADSQDDGQTESNEAAAPAEEASPAAESDSGASDTPSESDSTPDEQPSQSETAADPSSEPTEAASETPEPPAPPAAEIPEPIRRPKPDDAKIKKCIKEWQVGAHRVHQLVHWLCDPFGESDAGGTPPAVLATMPSLPTLKPGEQVIGVVVGVMPFGVFVELAPDCSGLIHVSKVSDGFVEDLHEAIQVGDVITSWVTGVDEKRRRVALSAVSPEREAEIQRQKQQQRGGGGRGGERGRPPRGGGGGGGREGRGRSGDQQGGRGKQGGGKPRAGGDRNRGQRSDSRGGRSRDSRGGAGGRRGREKKPESYRVVSKEPAKPITDAMQKGDEPLRSFGDLMQFYSQDEKQKSQPPQSEDRDSKAPPAEPPQAAPQDGGVTPEQTPPAADTDPTSLQETQQTDAVSGTEAQTETGTAPPAASEPSPGEAPPVPESEPASNQGDDDAKASNEPPTPSDASNS